MNLFNRVLFFTVLAGVLSLDLLSASGGVKGNKADYVIVGVGNAGTLLAKRLTDDKRTSVIALHSGKNFTNSFIIKYAKNTEFTVPATLLGAPLPFDIASLNLPPELKAQLQELLQLSSDAARPLYETGVTIPQVNADNRQILWAIPLPLAGGTSINAGAWCRGTNQVYAQWETIGGPEWSVGRILNIYKALENYEGKTPNPIFRGNNGPLKVQQQIASKLAQVFTEGIIGATGTPLVLDYNDPLTPIGATPQFQLTRKGHDSFIRVSGSTAFLDNEVMKHDGTGVDGRRLKVLFDSTGLRTIWKGNKAVGVEYIQNGVVKQAWAKKGVIVCAGLRSSPFLMHSGIGDATLLTSLGIPVIFDNPNVGQGLADQPQTLMIFTSNPNDALTKTNGLFSQISWLPAPGGDPTIRKLRFASIDLLPGLTPALLDLVQPESRGSVTINSPDPLAPPVIDLGLFNDPDDLAVYVAAYGTYIKNLNLQLQAIDPLYQLIYPDPAILDDPVLIADFVRAGAVSNLCFQCHCRMDALGSGGVVDSHGRVYGARNLFVADNSINPQAMDGTPMATGYLVAEQIAQFLGH